MAYPHQLSCLDLDTHAPRGLELVEGPVSQPGAFVVKSLEQGPILIRRETIIGTTYRMGFAMCDTWPTTRKQSQAHT